MQQAVHMNEPDPIAKTLSKSLAQRGPSTHESEFQARGNPLRFRQVRNCSSCRTVGPAREPDGLIAQRGRLVLRVSDNGTDDEQPCRLILIGDYQRENR